VTLQATLIDAELPSAPELLGSAGLELAAEVAEEAGGSTISVTPEQALYRPGSYLVMNYRAEVVERGEGPREEVVAVVADADELPEGTPRREVAGEEVAVWRFPSDPVLSSLEPALDSDVLRELLGELELYPRKVDVTPIVYRPTYRAVLRMELREDKLVFDRANGRLHVRNGEREVYLKILPSEYAAEVADVHHVLGSHLTVPACFPGWADRGLLALEGLPGLTLREFIQRRDGSPPPAEELIAVLDTIDGVVATEDRVRSMRRRVRSHARLLQTILPDAADRVTRLSDELRRLPSERPAVIHGDFYDAQILVDDDGSITGLLDLDGIGWGDPADDLATMLGRIWTSAHTSGRGRDRFLDYAGELLDGFSRRVDRRDLCMRVAAIVFGRITGPVRVQDPGWREAALERLELAELCLAHARRGELPW
jgi:hypothetical protein